MIRDDLPNEAHGTNVTDGQLNDNYSRHFTEGPSQTLSTQISSDSHSDNQIYNQTITSGRRFYNSYNPEVGVNTATVLGGILVVLVIYVIYRTKCRKRILKTFQNCMMKYFPDDFPELDSSGQSDQAKKVPESEWISKSAKMIWEQRANLSRDGNDAGRGSLINEVDTEGGREIPTRPLPQNTCPLSNKRPCVKNNGNCVVNMIPSCLPACEETVRQATATWVQNVREMDIRERQLNGIILKIPPDLVSHNVKSRRHFHSVTEYGEREENISHQINKSLPSLVEQQARIKKLGYAKLNIHPACRSIHSCGYVPLATQERDGLDIETRPNEHVSEMEVSESRAPIDICPIVKVQHYHLRSKRRLTSLCKSSSDDVSSSSSDDDADVTKCNLSARDAKYMRLQTEETDQCFKSDGHPLLHNNSGRQNCNNKSLSFPNKSETSL
ncbi:uncharacterized protein LOC128228870 [Mya arenaria]|uniref:uncharacterized protein LOC128228870 n=1 Tax=Mya arenaria TaxID=6604 RepID=UPI0022E28CDF|nr:uncharacterized protein LOC128228870 [Mya arenaria]